MEDRRGRVILVGTLASWDEPKGPDDQIWCINKGYEHQPNLDRLYLVDPMMDYIRIWGESFIEKINALGVPIILAEARNYIPNGRAFNFMEGLDRFGISFLGASTANAIGNAIEENFAEIVLHKMYLKSKSQDYLHHKGPMGFWIGQAISYGVNVTVDEDCFVSQETLDKMKEDCKQYDEPNVVETMAGMVEHEIKRQEIRRAAGSIN